MLEHTAGKFATPTELTHRTPHDVTTRVALDGCFCAVLLNFFITVAAFLEARKFLDVVD
jgi:hypothetical protein